MALYSLTVENGEKEVFVFILLLFIYLLRCFSFAFSYLNTDLRLQKENIVYYLIKIRFV